MIIPFRNIVKITGSKIRFLRYSNPLMDPYLRDNRNRIMPGGVYDPQRFGPGKIQMGVSILFLLSHVEGSFPSNS